jgi:flagellar motor switch protein FliM
LEPKNFDADKDEVVWNEGSPFTDLLGFDLSSEDGQDRSGLKALINSALVSHRRLPMLDVVFDRTARLMSTSLRQLTNENVEVTLDNVSSTRFGDFIQAQPQSGVIGVIHSKGLDGYALIAADGALVHCVVDLLLGGRRGSSAGLDSRALTAIELGLANRMLALLTEDFDEAFAAVKPAGFSLDRIETTPRFAAIAQDASVCALAKFKVRIDDFTTKATILAPHAMIEPVREMLLRDFIGESGAADEMWRNQFNKGVTSAGVDLKAVLADRVMTIGELGALKPGQTLTFSAAADARVELRAGGSAIARGRVGRLGETIAVKLDAPVNSGASIEDIGAAA